MGFEDDAHAALAEFLPDAVALSEQVACVHGARLPPDLAALLSAVLNTATILGNTEWVHICQGGANCHDLCGCQRALYDHELPPLRP